MKSNSNQVIQNFCFSFIMIHPKCHSIPSDQFSEFRHLPSDDFVYFGTNSIPLNAKHLRYNLVINMH